MSESVIDYYPQTTEPSELPEFEVTVDGSTFKSAVLQVAKVAPARYSDPMYTYILVEVGDDQVVLTGQDYMNVLSINIPAQTGEGNARFLVLASLLNNLIRSSNPREVKIYRTSPSKIGMDLDSLHTELIVAKPSGYPTFPEVPEDAQTIAINAKELKKVLSRVSYASKETDIPKFQGVQLELHDKTLRAVATDMYRLAIADVPLLESAEAEPVMLPSEAVSQLINITDGKEDLTIKLSENRILVELPAIRYAVSLMENQLPQYERVIPNGFVATLKGISEDLRGAISHMLPVVDRKKPRIDLLSNSSLMIEIQAEGDYGKAKESVPISVEGDMPEIIAFNARYLSEALSRIDGEFEIRISGSSTPTLITNAEQDYRAVIAPLRI